MHMSFECGLRTRHSCANLNSLQPGFWLQIKAIRRRARSSSHSRTHSSLWVPFCYKEALPCSCSYLRLVEHSGVGRRSLSLTWGLHSFSYLHYHFCLSIWAVPSAWYYVIVSPIFKTQFLQLVVYVSVPFKSETHCNCLNYLPTIPF